MEANPPSPRENAVSDVAPAAVAPAVPWWHLHRRLYDWVLHWADTPYGGWALFVMSLAESSCFPVPPDVLLMPLVLGNRRKWLRFAAMCSVASIVGGMLGYLIGLTVWDAIDQTVFAWHVPGLSPDNFAKAQGWYERYDFWVVAAAGFTPLPYKVITISAGAFKINFAVFLIASAASRSARFFLVAGLMGLFGPTIKPFIDRYFNLLCIVFMAMLVGGFALIKYIG